MTGARLRPSQLLIEGFTVVFPGKMRRNRRVRRDRQHHHCLERRWDGVGCPCLIIAAKMLMAAAARGLWPLTGHSSLSRYLSRRDDVDRITLFRCAFLMHNRGHDLRLCARLDRRPGRNRTGAPTEGSRLRKGDLGEARTPPHLGGHRARGPTRKRTASNSASSRSSPSTSKKRTVGAPMRARRSVARSYNVSRATISWVGTMTRQGNQIV